MKIVVTGSQGFIGKNLCTYLQEKHHDILKVNRKTTQDDIRLYLKKADFVFHLAGSNRPEDINEFQTINVDLTSFIVDELARSGRKIPLVLTSSTQATSDNNYGLSKLAAEKLVQSYSYDSGAASYIFRLPNVFGKWCKPNYNSFVATFCSNVLSGTENTINDPKAPVKLVYIDDVCTSLIELLDGKIAPGFQEIPIIFNTTVGEVADIISSFKLNRKTLITERVGAGLKRALYSTYLSYMSPENFSYSIPSNEDDRGIFCEMLKTKDSGQFSFFTAHPGITRGRHYHHTKNEKFLVMKGEAVFKFENIVTGQRHMLTVNGSNPEIVETVPGWTHDITNSGDEELIVMLWANEIFDPDRPDTITKELF
ncbi:NAD-dependent epimerase/dehydratase family protein [Gammaproteobacteria bacterium]|nr:NAD-dependent epimerase/dehydratase family protein [Gammaproteobacteria bacterium]